MKNRFSEVRDLVMGLEGDFQKFYEKSNKAAGTRVRKGMQELKNVAQDIRLGVQQAKNEGEGSSAKASAGRGNSKAGKR